MPLVTDSAVAVSQLWPELFLIGAACVLLLVGISRRQFLRAAVPWIAMAAIVIPWITMFFVSPSDYGGGGLAVGALAEYVRKIIITIGLLLLLVNWSQPAEKERGEYFAMMLFSLAGVMLTALADDLVMLFIALELVSIPAYIMVALSRNHPAGLEAGTKYFYLGAMSAAITAYGFSFLYGVSGTASISGAIDYHTLASALADPKQPAFALATIGMVFSIAGILFKLAAVPLHFYVADVYQGAASPISGFLGFVPKIAGVVAVIRILQLTAGQYTDSLFWLIWIVAALSMTVGNVLALWQSNVKRMLAYSGVAHSGYMLVGILAGSVVMGDARIAGAAGASSLSDGNAAVLYYVVVYGIANLAAFAVLSLLHVRGEPCETMRDLAGLVRRQPALAVLMTLAMFTLIGLPPTPGFWGKLSLFGSALGAAGQSPHQNWMVALVIIGLLNSAIGVAYYLRVAAACLLYENDRPADGLPREVARAGAVLCGCLLLIFTFAPQVLLRAARAAMTDRQSPTVTPSIVVGAKPGNVASAGPTATER